MTGTVADTYVAALQHGRFDPGEATLVGVVRRPTRWFNAAVERNRPALGPPESLLEEFRTRREEFEIRGLCEEGAHNTAWDAIDFVERYRDYLAGSPDAGDAVEELRARVAAGEDLVLVCYENTDKKRCHRTELREHLTDD